MLFIYATDIDYLRRLFQGPENRNFWGLESWKWECLDLIRFDSVVCCCGLLLFKYKDGNFFLQSPSLLLFSFSFVFEGWPFILLFKCMLYNIIFLCTYVTVLSSTFYLVVRWTFPPNKANWTLYFFLPMTILFGCHFRWTGYNQQWIRINYRRECKENETCNAVFLRSVP